MTMQPSVTRIARALLGRTVHGHGVSVRLTEVEAYAGPDDPASHAYRRTPRSEIMYGPADRLYVYRIHGHHCANVVCGAEEDASAILLRAGEVVEGIDLARRRRPSSRTDDELAAGPGRLTIALGITMADLGTDLTDGEPVCLAPEDDVAEDGDADRATISAGPRVGVRLAANRPWRFWIAGDPTVSAYRRHPRA